MTGTVKYLKKDNGYFFIAPDHGGHEIFGHVNVCSTSLNFAALMVGDKVTYEDNFDHTRGKLRAINITLG